MHQIFCLPSLARLMFVRSLLCLGLTAVVAFAVSDAELRAAESATGFVSRVYQDDAGQHRYSVFVPADYTPDRKWPVILFLHGAGERGTDGELPTTIGLGPIVRARAKTFPFIVVFPQAENPKGRILPTWQADAPDGRRALEILAEVERDYNVDPKRRILTGWSMGGYGTWAMAAARPEHWSAVVPVAGGGDEGTADRLKSVPIWAFHGVKDLAVRVTESRRMIEAVRKAGGDPRYTEYPEADHSVWRTAYDTDELYAWMLDPLSPVSRDLAVHARPRPRVDLPRDPSQPEPPFMPAIDIPDAMYARLGNDMFAALSDAIPRVIPRDALVGRLNDISDTTSAEGRTFSVYFSNISYRAELVRAAVRAYRKDAVNVQLGLRNVTITIGSTSVSGSGKSAVAGPIQIVIGSQRPVWLSFDVKPVIKDRRLRMVLLGSTFNIPDDNWYVTSPAGVSTRGLGMTASRVTDGLVSGLYGSKYRIQQQITSVVPGLLGQLEDKVDLSAADKVVAGIWPLPVYRPRMRTWPAAVSTDERGVSITLGITVAGLDPQRPPRQWRTARPVGIPVSAIPRTILPSCGDPGRIIRC